MHTSTLTASIDHMQKGERVIILGPTLDPGWAMARKGERVGGVPLNHFDDRISPVRALHGVCAVDAQAAWRMCAG